MSYLKLLNIAIILNAIAAVLELAFALFKPGAHTSQGLVISATVLVIMTILRSSVIKRENIDSQQANTRL